DLTVDFGFYRPVSVGDFVWNDVNGNGVQDTGEAGIGGEIGRASWRGSVMATQTTSGNGGYLFGGLAPGAYTVQVDTASPALVGFVATATGQGTAATDSNPNPSAISPSTLASGQSDLTVDFGFYKPATLGDFVWNDANANGLQDTGEAGIGG